MLFNLGQKGQCIFICFAKNAYFIWIHIMFLDAYEYYYGDHREEGHDLIREYCGSKTHFRVKIDVPHREHEHEISLPPQSRLSIPSVFLSGM